MLCDNDAILVDKEIQRIYGSIGFDDRTLYARIASPFRGETALVALTTIFWKEDYHHGREQPEREVALLSPGSLYTALKDASPFLMDWFLALLLYLIVPTAAQVAAGFKVSEIVQQAGFGWVWILFVLLAAATGFLALVYTSRPTDESVLRALGEQGGLLQRLGWLLEDFTLTVVLFLLFTLPGIAIGFFVAKFLGHLLAS